ncbi:hypothetical protein FKG94_11335 [Exilibacterium tricleocarpae]|uniref:Uncharacterized protein n=1 Tax=Exilibacterium tricleocarpae TaxID=2591008 RepID=A0A545TQF9_9GAMM|nr:hypothetical protein [Exilibacterium tricleocarpae]TQV79454.1 hypothetical protein FKG94_11335 [Exilibacterium tricleocarpae]
MNRELAKKLMSELLECHRAMDIAEFTAREIKDEKLSYEIRHAIVSASSHLYSDAMGRIISRFPELEPYPSEGEQEQERGSSLD